MRLAAKPHFIRPEGFHIPPESSALIGGIAVHRVSDKTMWSLNHWFVMSSLDNLDGAEAILRQSYGAVSKVSTF